MRAFFEKYPLLKNRYFIVTVLFLVWMLIFDQNNFFHQYDTQKELNSMRQKEAYLDSEIARNRAQIEKLENPEELERYAREKYWMKKDNEDLFIILDSADTILAEYEPH